MNRTEITDMLKGDGLNPHVEQTILRDALIREANLIRAGVMQETWGEDRIPEKKVGIHRPRELKDDLPEIVGDSFFSKFTRLYSP